VIKNFIRSTRLSSIALVASASLVVSACASSEAETSSSEVVSSSSQTITWWSWDSNPVQEDMIAAFNEEFPDITVEYQRFNFSDYLTALRSGLSSDSGPDVFQVAPGGMLASYGDLAVDLAPLVSESLGADWETLFNSTAVEQLNQDGKQVAMPTYLSAAGLIYYNQTLVEELGIEIPGNLPEWAETCAQVNAAGYTCLTHGAAESWVNTDVFLALANSAEPGLIYDAIEGNASWTSDGLLTAMNSWEFLFTSGIVGAGATAVTQYPDAFNSFLSSEAVFVAMGTWNTPGTQTVTGMVDSQAGLERIIDGEFLSAPFPAVSEEVQSTLPFGGVANGWALSSRSQAPEAAFEFIKFLSAGEGQNMIGGQASFPSFLSAPVNTGDVIFPSQVADIERQQSSLEQLVGYREIPYPDLAAAIGIALSAVAGGTQSPAEALAALQAASDSVDRG